MRDNIDLVSGCADRGDDASEATLQVLLAALAAVGGLVAGAVAFPAGRAAGILRAGPARRHEGAEHRDREECTRGNR